MVTFFQNLNESKKSLFHFRGAFSRDYKSCYLRYELVSGLACRLSMEPYEHKTSFTFGLLFFTLYLTIYKLKIPLITKGRQYGFYLTDDYEVRFFFGKKPMESSSSDPWYYCFYFKPITLLLGKRIYFTSDVLKSYGPRFFKFRGKEYKMNELKITKSFWFRSRVPFGLYKKTRIGMDLKIDKPPMRAGKGENSWDCDDDGIFGMRAPYAGPEVSWKNQEEIFKYCIEYYCKSAHRDILKYGRASGDTLHRDEFVCEYVGHKSEQGNALNK